ncbi:hypothetical protein Dsin_029825 [Dipteronia sinensis]|uniref:Uncharacterized protein n=1 Tax=Dipteronia sinensis TaxID=43782 RepID=A0AAD9ZTI1_9ROSI|nr:hypothetical protein Dsin_029825 [Dipteronia sinensis]
MMQRMSWSRDSIVVRGFELLFFDGDQLPDGVGPIGASQSRNFIEVDTCICGLNEWGRSHFEGFLLEGVHGHIDLDDVDLPATKEWR